MLHTRPVEFLKGSQALGLYPEGTLLVEDRRRRVFEYQAPTVILATGGRERYLPFKGWTLPGVMSTGAAQILMKSSGTTAGILNLRKELKTKPERENLLLNILRNSRSKTSGS